MSKESKKAKHKARADLWLATVQNLPVALEAHRAKVGDKRIASILQGMWIALAMGDGTASTLKASFTNGEIPPEHDVSEATDPHEDWASDIAERAEHIAEQESMWSPEMEALVVSVRTAFEFDDKKRK